MEARGSADTFTKPKKQNSSQQGRKGHKGSILNSATLYPKCSVFAALVAFVVEIYCLGVSCLLVV
jgi:hypothetical protein